MAVKCSIKTQNADMVKLKLELHKYRENLKQKDICVKGIKITFKLQNPPNSYNDEDDMNCLSIKLTNENAFEWYGCVIKSDSLFDKRTVNYLCDDSEWREIYEYYEGDCPINIDLTIEVKPITEIMSISTISNQFSPLHEDTKLTDFKLGGEDGSVEVHSFVLAASSPVFRAMLEKQFKETEDRCYHIKDASQTTLQHLKDYMYTNALPKTGVEELLLLAHCYMMPELEKKCIKILLDNLSTENVMEMTKFAVGNSLKTFFLAIMRRVESGSVRIGDEDF